MKLAILVTGEPRYSDYAAYHVNAALDALYRHGITSDVFVHSWDSVTNGEYRSAKKISHNLLRSDLKNFWRTENVIVDSPDDSDFLDIESAKKCYSMVTKHYDIIVKINHGSFHPQFEDPEFWENVQLQLNLHENGVLVNSISTIYNELQSDCARLLTSRQTADKLYSSYRFDQFRYLHLDSEISENAWQEYIEFTCHYVHSLNINNFDMSDIPPGLKIPNGIERFSKQRVSANLIKKLHSTP